MRTNKLFYFSLIILIVFLIGCSARSKSIHRPNILFAISDDQSFPHTSFAGCSFVNTPAFDRIAKEGLYFSNCIASSPGCAPSRGSIVTGRHPWQNEQCGQHASSWLKKYVPFTDLLEANGYSIGRTGKGVDPFQYAQSLNDSLWRHENAAGPAYNMIRYNKDSIDERVSNEVSMINYFENFKVFLKNKPDRQPFFFWYGSVEPHRNYERDSYKNNGKVIDDVDVPGFLPENNIIRGDLLDYAVEIEWFDYHLQKMVNYLEEIGELNQTVIIITSDNGFPFPRAKANCYEYGIHVPLAIKYPNQIGGRVIDQPVSFVDIAPTILEITKTSSEGMMPISGKSLTPYIFQTGQKLITNKYVFSGRERHSSSRYNNMGYPQRAVRSKEFLFIWNSRPERWPAGDPQRFDPKDEDKLLPLYGLDSAGSFHSEWAFTDIDDGPSKSFIIENHLNPIVDPYFQDAVSKRTEYELYDVITDPSCLNNLVGKERFREIEHELKSALFMELKETEDPRVTGEGDLFDTYERYGSIRSFPNPDRSK